MSVGRSIAPRWVERFLNEIPESHLEIIRRAIGRLPAETDHASVVELLEMVSDGRAHCYTYDFEGQPQAVCFFELQKLRDGSRNLHCLAVAAAPGSRADIGTQTPVLDQLARQAGCRSLSVETVRPGVLRTLHAHGWQACSVVCRKLVTP